MRQLSWPVILVPDGLNIPIAPEIWKPLFSYHCQDRRIFRRLVEHLVTVIW